MTTILKFALKKERQNIIDMPANGVIFAVQPQHGFVTIWMKCDEEDNYDAREFVCISTGSVVPAGKYLGTCQFHDGHTVVHVFEVP